MCVNGTATITIVDTIQGVGYSPVFFLGFVVNVAALRAFIAKRNSWTETHIYMLNLALADFTLILFLPFRIYDAFFCLPKTYFCTFLLYIHFINMYASIFTSTAISVHRYLAIRFPLQARSWRKKKETAFAVCLIIWGLLIIISSVFHEENSPKNLWTCYERQKDHPLSAGSVALLVCVGYALPMLITGFCTNQIICVVLRTHEKSEQKKRVVGIVTANIIVFVVCYTPIHVAFLVNHLYKVPKNWQSTYLPSHIYLLVSEWIASTNCFFDSISYYFLLKQIYS